MISIFLFFFLHFCTATPEISKEFYPKNYDFVSLEMRNNHLIYPEGLSEKFSAFTELLVFIIINVDLIKRLTTEQHCRAFHIVLMIIKRTLSKLHHTLTRPEVLKRFLPRVEDQADLKHKILAKYRRDMLYPWATKISSLYMTPSNLEFLGNPKSESAYINNFEIIMASHNTDDRPIFVPSMTFCATTIGEMRKNFFCYTRQIIYEIIYKMVHMQTGLELNSVKEIYETCNVSGLNYSLIQHERGSLENIFYQLPSVRFTEKIQLDGVNLSQANNQLIAG